MTTHYQKYGKKNYAKTASSQNARARRWYSENKDRAKASQRNNHLKRKFGITSDQYDEMLRSQFGSCRLCDRIFDTNLHVDHDHKTGKIRGLLCLKCNITVGYYETGFMPSEKQIQEYLTK